MQIDTKFSIGQSVRVVRDGGFIGPVIGVHVDITEQEQSVSYDVKLPENRRGHGRNHMNYWRYREDWLEAE